MSGYCGGCGCTICLCDESDDINMSKFVLIEKECLDKHKRQVEIRDKVIEELEKMLLIGCAFDIPRNACQQFLKSRRFQEWKKARQ